jgi:hypothetical protein
MRAKTSASQAFGSMSLREAVMMRVYMVAAFQHRGHPPFALALVFGSRAEAARLSMIGSGAAT